jgi:hypothetical protein
MAEIGAAALFPGLPTASPAADPAPAASVYGPSANGGLDHARNFAAGGTVKPADAPRSEPGRPPPKDWLAELSDRGEAKEPTERATVAGSAQTYLDLEGLRLDDTPAARDFSETASELGIDQIQASKLVPIYQKALAEHSVAYWTKTESDWASASRREFGSRLDTMVQTVQPLLNDNQLTTKDFRELLGQFGLGSNPHVVQTLAQWAGAIRAARRGR